MIREDYPGYVDKTKNKEFIRFYDSLYENIGTVIDVYQCFLKLTTYILFFKDRHLILGINPTAEVKKIIAKTYANSKSEIEPIKNDTTQNLIKGLWELKTAGSYYKIKIEGNEAEGYTGIIVAADSLYWYPGQLKLFVRHIQATGKYIGRFLQKDHIAVDIVVSPLTHDVLDFGNFGIWVRSGGSASASEIQRIIAEKRQAKVFNIDSTALCIRIPSFDIPYYNPVKRIIDSLKMKVLKPNLILDLRDNSGGTKLVSNMLLDYTYTNPVKMSGFSFKTSKRNIEDLENLIRNSDYNDKIDTAGLRAAIIEYKMHPDSLYPVTNDYELSRDSIFKTPKKVYIIVNRFSSSATEYFLLQAKQSSKVIVVGENTRGAIDYTDQGDQHFLPCALFFYRTPRYRSNRVDKHAFDGKGIAPDITVPPGEDVFSVIKKIIDND